MKKHNILILTFLICLLFIGCKPNKEKAEIDLSKTDFIYIENEEFKHRNNSFFPFMLNYSACIRKIDSNFVISPIIDYETPGAFEVESVEESINQVKGHFKLIKELGFNTIRIVALEHFWNDNKGGKYSIPFYNKGKKESVLLESHMDMYFDRIAELLELAKEQDLRLMLLLRSPIDSELVGFTEKLLERFSSEPTVFAYDFFNEPLYFDNQWLTPDKRKREKKDAFDIVEGWKEMMDEFAPNQLFTIGFSEPIEVFEWDPSILPVDFLAFHTYHPLRVPNEIYWYAKYTNKPWMIGETSLPADNDSIPYESQSQFMKEVYERIVNCGGIGLGWWSFQDVSWGGFEHDYTSLLNHEGETWTADSSHRILGTLKPAAFELKKLKDYKPTNDCPCWVNYENMLGYENIVIKGKVVNGDNGQAIEGAVIRGWNKTWGIGANTYSNSKGEFKMYSNTEFVHFAISAPGMNTIKFDFNGEYTPVNGHNQPMDSLENQGLEYHGISHIPFLNNDTSRIEDNRKVFNFEKDMFSKAKFEVSMPTKELTPLKITLPEN